MTVQEALAEGIGLLKSPNVSSLIDTPALDASVLLAETLELDKTELILRGNERISDRDLEYFKKLLERRMGGECIAYILGRKEFRGLNFSVNSQVLVPRPDTETLHEAALEYIDSDADPGIFLLDLCTGSGALAISLLNERPNLSVTASDISSCALETARLNAKRLLPSVRNSIHFVQSCLFENIPGKFNIIVCNAPYVPSGELSGLAPEVRREPALALDGGEDGLFIIRKIIAQAPEHLFPGGTLLLEADPNQMPVIRAFLEAFGFTGVRISKDLAGRDRVISAFMA